MAGGGCQESYLGETGDELQSRWVVHRQQSKLERRQAPVQPDLLELVGKEIILYSLIKKFRLKLNGKLY